MKTPITTLVLIAAAFTGMAADPTIPIVPPELFLDIDKPGEHEITISMREDGFELDKFLLASIAVLNFVPADKVPLKTWAPHVADCKTGDPTWKSGKGKGLIGALNYLSDKGLNVFSFLPYNAGGDGDNVWPFVERDDKLHYDCSKLDQWGVVFDHATARGLYLHFKLQENELDDDR